MRVLLDARQKLGFQWEKPERANNIESITRYKKTMLLKLKKTFLGSQL